ncbi:MAG: MFS transporter, partial [Promethearchaeota archaeon]
FFEPYLIVIFLFYNLSFFQIGILFAVNKAVTLILEVPSGFFADRYGRKNGMLLCFTFYIVSFVIFFVSEGFFWFYFVAMVAFGFGEAFRTGTHKAIIFEYLDRKGWKDHKAFVYGRTRSTSLIGSSISAVASVFFILLVPADKYIFLVTIIPYVVDFILVASYPGFTNKRIQKTEDTTRKTKKEDDASRYGKGKEKISIKKDFRLVSIILNSAFYNAIYDAIKDYIQPLMEYLLVMVIAFSIWNFSVDDTLKIVLGIIYCTLNIAGSYSSKNSYKMFGLFGKRRSRRTLNDFFYYITALILGLIAFGTHFKIPIIVVLLYFIIYILFNLRRPIILETIDQNLKKALRTTTLSLESLLKSLLVMIIAPLIGLTVDMLGLEWLFTILAVILALFNVIFRLPATKNVAPEEKS